MCSILDSFPMPYSDVSFVSNGNRSVREKGRRTAREVTRLLEGRRTADEAVSSTPSTQIDLKKLSEE